MMQTHFTPFPELHTERLALRALVPADAPALFVLRSDPRIMNFIDRPPAETIAEVEALMQRIELETAAGKSVFWGMSLKNSPQLIGNISLWNLDPETATAELGYVLHPDFWGQGYMQEALVCAVAFGLEVMGARMIEAYLRPGNLRSVRLVERNGFRRSRDEDGFWVYGLQKE
ncbi:MAG: GNAT family N-acetyltransferase [Saprospiraceae bacterium]